MTGGRNESDLKVTGEYSRQLQSKEVLGVATALPDAE
jgi:hypothetical protein